MSKPMLIFDGECGFCTWCAEWAQRHLHGRAAVVPGQTVDVARYGLSPGDVTKAAWWIDPAGRAHRGHRAVGRTLATCGGWWRVLSWLFLVPPFSWAASVGYAGVVRNRHRFPWATPACGVEPPEGTRQQ